MMNGPNKKDVTADVPNGGKSESSTRQKMHNEFGFASNRSNSGYVTQSEKGKAFSKPFQESQRPVVIGIFSRLSGILQELPKSNILPVQNTNHELEKSDSDFAGTIIPGDFKFSIHGSHVEMKHVIKPHCDYKNNFLITVKKNGEKKRKMGKKEAGNEGA